MVLTHAAAVHGVAVKVEPVDLARVALKRLGLIGKSRCRDRRPTADEIKRLLDHFDNNRFLMIPMGRIVRFAIASAMRQEEICRIRWSDVDITDRVVKLQTGYLYHYAFAMLIGVAALVTWMMLGGSY